MSAPWCQSQTLLNFLFLIFFLIFQIFSTIFQNIFRIDELAWCIRCFHHWICNYLKLFFSHRLQTLNHVDIFLLLILSQLFANPWVLWWSGNIQAPLTNLDSLGIEKAKQNDVLPVLSVYSYKTRNLKIRILRCLLKIGLKISSTTILYSVCFVFYLMIWFWEDPRMSPKVRHSLIFLVPSCFSLLFYPCPPAFQTQSILGVVLWETLFPGKLH